MRASAFKTARGHSEPFAVQFSVFMPNRVGQFQKVLEDFSANDVEVIGVSVIDSTDWAVVRMIFNDPGHAREILRRRNESFTESEVLLVELHSPSALKYIFEHLLRAEINVHFAFPLTIRNNQNPVMALHVDDTTLSTQILIRHQFILLGSEDLSDPG